MRSWRLALYVMACGVLAVAAACGSGQDTALPSDTSASVGGLVEGDGGVPSQAQSPDRVRPTADQCAALETARTEAVMLGGTSVSLESLPDDVVSAIHVIIENREAVMAHMALVGTPRVGDTVSDLRGVEELRMDSDVMKAIVLVESYEAGCVK